MTVNRIGSLVLALSFLMIGCSTSSHASPELPSPAKDIPMGKPSELRQLVLAGGCFWCTEGVYENVDGITDVVSGYSGGSKEDANYEKVSSGTTGHAESVKITYDSSKISYGRLLQIFFTVFNPTTLDAQGPDHGHQYRSAIFYQSDEEKDVAAAYIKQLTEAKIFSDPIVTTLENFDAFYPAEDYHQNFMRLNSGHPYIMQIARPKVEKLKEHTELSKQPASTQPSK